MLLPHYTGQRKNPFYALFPFFFNPRKCYFPWADPSSTTLTVSSCTVPSAPATQKSPKFWWKVRAVCWSDQRERWQQHVGLGCLGLLWGWWNVSTVHQRPRGEICDGGVGARVQESLQWWGNKPIWPDRLTGCSMPWMFLDHHWCDDTRAPRYKRWLTLNAVFPLLFILPQHIQFLFSHVGNEKSS